MADYLGWNAESMHWELDILAEFMYLIYSTKIRWDVEDHNCWRPTKSRLFEVKSFYRLLYTGDAHVFPVEEHLEG